jgi:hypothetical protein
VISRSSLLATDEFLSLWDIWLVTVATGAVGVEGAAGRAVPAEDVGEAVGGRHAADGDGLFDELVPHRLEAGGRHGDLHPVRHLSAAARHGVDDRQASGFLSVAGAQLQRRAVGLNRVVRVHEGVRTAGRSDRAIEQVVHVQHVTCLRTVEALDLEDAYTLPDGHVDRPPELRSRRGGDGHRSVGLDRVALDDRSIGRGRVGRAAVALHDGGVRADHDVLRCAGVDGGRDVGLGDVDVCRSVRLVVVGASRASGGYGATSEVGERENDSERTVELLHGPTS